MEEYAKIMKNPYFFPQNNGFCRTRRGEGVRKLRTCPQLLGLSSFGGFIKQIKLSKLKFFVKMFNYAFDFCHNIN